jgi:hypothetical protein
MCNCQEALWARASEVNAQSLVAHATEAAQSHIAYSRALDSSRLAEVLIGENAGKERAWTAEHYFASRTASLRRLRQALDEFRASPDPGQSLRADQLIAQGAVGELAARARHMAVAALLDSDVSPGAARSAMTALDQRIEEIQSAASFEQLAELLARYTDDHIARGYEDAAQDNGLCELILILSSLFAVLIVLAAILCVFTLGYGCSDILNQLINQVCSGTSTVSSA